MNSRLQDLKEKYLRGWEQQATVILLASGLLLTLHRYYSRRSFFRQHFAEYFINIPLPESHSLLLLVSDDSTHLTPRACPRCAIWNKGAVEGLRISTRESETGMEHNRGGMVSDGACGYSRCHRVPTFRGKVSAQ